MTPQHTSRHLAALVGLAAAACAVPAGAISIDVFPRVQSMQPGATFAVDIRASGVPSHEVLTYFGLLLGYDANVLEALGVTFSDALGVEASGESFSNSVLDYDPNDVTGDGGSPAGYAGSYEHAVELASFTWLDPSTTSGTQADRDYLKSLQSPEPVTLATVEFRLSTTAPTGSYTLALITDADFTNPAAGGFYDIKGRELSNILTITSQTDSGISVPLPATAALLAGGALLLVRRRRSA
jgi:hypothetical protein